MGIYFTSFRLNDNYVKGKIEKDGKTYKFSSKLFDGSSDYGIDKGRISKLHVMDSDKDRFGNVITLVNYDRGWDVTPDTEEDKEILARVVEFLESAPTYRFKHPKEYTN